MSTLSVLTVNRVTIAAPEHVVRRRPFCLLFALCKVHGDRIYIMTLQRIVNFSTTPELLKMVRLDPRGSSLINVHLIAAARPNFMKVAPLYHALKKTDWAKPIFGSHGTALRSQYARCSASRLKPLMRARHRGLRTGILHSLRCTGPSNVDLVDTLAPIVDALVDAGLLIDELKTILDSNLPRGEQPPLWDGKTDNRAVASLKCRTIVAG